MLKGLPTGSDVGEGKNGKRLCVQWPHSAIIPTSDGGGQGHLMPVWVARTVPRWTVRGAPVRHDGEPVSVACHRTPQAARRRATFPWESPRVTRGRVSWCAGL